jgi:methylated-DNA-[protein]-cysteine S-methyltransferase
MRCGCRSEVFKTSLGWAGAAFSERGVRRVVLPRRDRGSVEIELGQQAGRGARNEGASRSCDPGAIRKAVTLFRKYFSGERVTFDLLPDLRYYTAFRQAVWRAAASIPYGKTRSYRWIAKRIGRPRAARAVGQALGANPVPIVVP